MSVTRQMSLFGAEDSPPEPGDLSGLLAGSGQISRRAGVAQVSIVVDHPWRSSVLVAECARRSLAATCVSTVDRHIGVRTAYSALLAPLADAWIEGAVKRVPRGLLLDGRALRLWILAEGRREGTGAYILPLGRTDDAASQTVGAALAAVGLAAQLVSLRGGMSLSYRIVGKRRLSRLVEMVGDPPKQAPPDIWPS
jgi:hypothetical protein